MQALKVLVVVMGIMIVAGVAVVVVTIAKRASEGAASPVPVAAAAPFEPVTITLPPASRILGAAADSGRLVLQSEHADGSRGFIVLDLASGRELGRITVKGDGNP